MTETSTLKLDAMPTEVSLDVWRVHGQPMSIEPTEYDDPLGKGPSPDVTCLELAEAALYQAFNRCGHSIEEVELAAERGIARCVELRDQTEATSRDPVKGPLFRELREHAR
jgi:hypothetical protein